MRTRAPQVSGGKAAEESQLLLRETNHRVQNNLHAAISTLRIRSRAAGSESTQAIEAAIVQLQAFAEAHRLLTEPSTESRVDLHGYVERLCDVWRTSDLDVSARPAREGYAVIVPSDLARRLGLIVAELVTNASRHAYDGIERGPIIVEVDDTPKSGEVTVSVQDHGRGMPEGVVAESGRGMDLVRRLANQVNGRCDWRSTGAGTRASIAFSLVGDGAEKPTGTSNVGLQPSSADAAGASPSSKPGIRGH